MPVNTINMLASRSRRQARHPMCSASPCTDNNRVYTGPVEVTRASHV